LGGAEEPQAGPGPEENAEKDEAFMETKAAGRPFRKTFDIHRVAHMLNIAKIEPKKNPAPG